MKAFIFLFFWALASVAKAQTTPDCGNKILPIFIQATDTPRLFLPGIVCSENPEFGGTLSPDGNTFWFNRMSPDRLKMSLLETRFENEQWSPPSTPAFADTGFWEIDPWVWPHGQGLVFSSKRPLPNSGSKDFNLWYTDLKTGDITPFSGAANTDGDEIFCSVSQQENLYFARSSENKFKIFCAKFEQGVFKPSVQIAISGTDTASISNPAISLYERFLVFASAQLGGEGGADLFLSFKQSDAQWSAPQNLGPSINTPYAEFAPSFSSDGNTLFFTSERPGMVQDFSTGKRRPGDIYSVAFDSKALGPMPPNEEVSFLAKDGTRVFANLFFAGDKPDKSKPLLLLFHMARSNGRAEYQNIAPRLLDLGYNLLVVDLREGGSQEYGGENRTVKALSQAVTEAYCIAQPDVEAALDFAISQGFSGKKILWGSGFSAALVLQVAADQPDNIAGVLAFAPAQGGAVSTCEPDESLLSRLKVPIAAFRAEAEMNQPGRTEQSELFKKAKIPYHIVEGNRHGSSVLDVTRNSLSTEATWDIVRGFLQKI
ncbi:MAG: dienelactone hydrolase family protein [Saprospiraceae bacterium]